MRVPQGGEEEWAEMRRYAHTHYAQQPGFGGARVLRERGHPNHCIMQSDWDSRDECDHAVRAVGMPWLTRGLNLQPDDFTATYFETIDPLHQDH